MINGIFNREGDIAVAKYETLFIVHPEKGPRLKEFIDRFKRVIEGQEGVVAEVEEWGLRDLAYRIAKQGKGYYTLLHYRAGGRAVDELERNLKLTDGILRYLTVRNDEAPDAPPQVPANGGSEQTAEAPEDARKTES